MATSNFHNVNASHIFACSLEDEWDYEDLVGNLESELNNHKDYSDYGKSDPIKLSTNLFHTERFTITRMSYAHFHPSH